MATKSKPKPKKSRLAALSPSPPASRLAFSPHLTGGKAWMNTYTGKKAYPYDLQPDQVCIEDIAVGLSNIKRFGGMTRFSVAQHSVNVSLSLLLKAEPNKLKPEEALLGLYGLLHDASEAYLGDLISPLKNLPMFAFYREAEERAMKAIYTALDLPPPSPVDANLVKLTDAACLADEMDRLWPKGRRHPDWKQKEGVVNTDWTPGWLVYERQGEVSDRFLYEYNYLTKQLARSKR